MHTELLSTGKAADRLGVHRSTLLQWVRDGKVRAFRLPGGGHLRFRPDDIDALLEPVDPEQVA